MVSGRARVRVPPAGSGQWMLNWLGKVRFFKVAKTCTVFQGPL